MEEVKISDWNEANLKMKRLHDAQERINVYKRDAKGITDGKFNYEWWIKDIDVLYGEGKAKYNDSEVKKTERIFNIIDKKLKLSPPHKRVYIDGIGRSQSGFIVDEVEFENIIDLIREFESLVKEFNDKHGLSTKNAPTAGLF